MDEVDRFRRTLTDLEVWVSTNETSQILRDKVTTLGQDWTGVLAEHLKLVEDFDQLKRTSCPSTTKSEGLKLITKPRNPNQHGDNLFNRRATHRQDLEQDGMSSATPETPPTPLSPPAMTSTGAGIGVMEIVRRMSSASTRSSSSPSSSFHSPDVSITSKTIRQRGRETQFEFFQEIFPSPILENVTCFVLNFLQIDTTLLFDSLERCPNLTYIEFIRVIFQGPFNRRVLLPNLKNFLVVKMSSERRLCESKNMTQVEFFNFLFFCLWEQADPIPLNVSRIELMVDGWTQFKLNYDSGEFVSRLPFANDILRQLSPRFKLRRLALQACKFKFECNAYDNLTYLNFQSILTSAHDLAEVLGQSQDLQELRFKNYIDGGSLRLKDVPSKKLKFLCLGLCTYTLAIKYSPDVEFDLDTLIFPTNVMDDATLEHLPEIFNAKKVVVYLCSHGARCKNGYYILNKLLQIRSIEWIWLSNLRRSLIGDDLTNPIQLELMETYENFLVRAGLPVTSSTSVILEKKDVAAGSSWVGREMTKEEHQVLEFQHRDGYKFSTWEAHMKRY